jgi:hypothetical protein
MSAWDEALIVGAIEGAWLKFTKGNWTLGGAPVDVGPDGLRIVVLMPTALHGAVQWADGKITDRQLVSYEDSRPSGDALEDGWSPNTSFQCIGTNGIHTGLLATFASTSWGARNAFKTLIAPYARKSEREFPIITLGSRTRETGQYRVLDPCFSIVAWAPRTDYAALVPPFEEKIVRLEAPKQKLQPAPRKTADIIDDDFPF